MRGWWCWLFQRLGGVSGRDNPDQPQDWRRIRACQPANERPFVQCGNYTTVSAVELDPPKLLFISKASG